MSPGGTHRMSQGYTRRPTEYTRRPTGYTRRDTRAVYTLPAPRGTARLGYASLLASLGTPLSCPAAAPVRTQHVHCRISGK